MRTAFVGAPFKAQKSFSNAQDQLLEQTLINLKIPTNNPEKHWKTDSSVALQFSFFRENYEKSCIVESISSFFKEANA